MKVLVIGQDPYLFEADSDVQRRIASYARHFDAYHVVAFSDLGHPARMQGEGFWIYPTNSRTKIFRFWDGVRIARKIAAREGIDVIDAQDAGEAGLAAYLVSRRTGIPFRLQIHTDIMSLWYRRASWKEFVRYALARFLIPRASCVRVVSERVRRSLREARIMKQESRITVLPIFTDISTFLTASRDSATDARFRDYDFRMVAVGRFVEKEKNFCMAIDMMREFVQTHPKALLVLVGEGPDKEKYESRIRNQGLEKNVLLEPWRNDMPSFLKSFDALLLTSNYEGWGRTVIEGMAAGLAVVMTDVGLAGEVVKDGENGFVAPVGDREALLRACRLLADDPARRRQLADVGEHTVRGRFGALTPESYARLYADALKSCT